MITYSVYLMLPMCIISGQTTWYYITSWGTLPWGEAIFYCVSFFQLPIFLYVVWGSIIFTPSMLPYQFVSSFFRYWLGIYVVEIHRHRLSDISRRLWFLQCLCTLFHNDPRAWSVRIMLQLFTVISVVIEYHRFCCSLLFYWLWFSVLSTICSQKSVFDEG